MIGVVTISPAQFANYMHELGEKFIPTMVKGVQAGAQRSIAIMQRRTAEAPPASPNGTRGAVDKGFYKAAWRTRPLPNGAAILNDRPYAGVIEWGRRPSPVNKTGISNLESWAKHKMHLSTAEARAAAFAIASTLRQRPLRERLVMSDGADEMTDAVVKEVEHEMEAALK